jgi:excisionase family DNA binding protein
MEVLDSWTHHSQRGRPAPLDNAMAAGKARKRPFTGATANRTDRVAAMYHRVELGSEDSHMPADDLLTAAEVAALLRMTPAWVYEETRRNRIPHMRLGRYFRYRRSTIDAWMSQLETGPDLAGRSLSSIQTKH